MAISTGDTLPDATLMRVGDDGPEQLQLSDITADKKVIILAMPGAFTGTCTTAHIPSFIRTKDQFDAKGVDDIICITTNDPFVVKAWSDATGAADSGITMLADATGAFAEAIGTKIDVPPVGLYSRSKRLSMLVDNGKVEILNLEDNPGVCDVSGGESMLEAMG